MSIILIPIASLVMFGRMLNNMRHAAVIFGVMLVLSAVHRRLGDLLRHDAAEPGSDRRMPERDVRRLADPASEGGQADA